MISEWEANNRCIESSVNKHSQILAFLICSVTLYLYGYDTQIERQTETETDTERRQAGGK